MQMSQVPINYSLRYTTGNVYEIPDANDALPLDAYSTVLQNIRHGCKNKLSIEPKR